MDPKKLEQKVIKKFGGRSTPASGATFGQKADGHVGFRLRIEHKFTKKGSYNLSEKVLLKLERDCIESKGDPVLIISFPRGKSLVLFPNHYADFDPARVESLPLLLDPYDYGIFVRGGSLTYDYATASFETAKALLGLALAQDK